MAYLHCHTKDCGWSQDDFWHYNMDWKNWKRFLAFRWLTRPFGYNPFSILLEDIAEYIKPRKIQMDSYWAKEQGLKSNMIHSWWFLKQGFKRYKRVRKNMLFKTWDEFQANKDTHCPSCGKVNWDID